jgi:hypothetical protein
MGNTHHKIKKLVQISPKRDIQTTEFDECKYLKFLWNVEPSINKIALVKYIYSFINFQFIYAQHIALFVTEELDFCFANQALKRDNFVMLFALSS